MLTTYSARQRDCSVLPSSADCECRRESSPRRAFLMYPNHQRTIQRVIDHFQPDPSILALIIGGSVAKGWAAETSDVDIMLVVTDEEFARRSASGDMLYFTRDFCDYEGGYVDGKFVDMAFLNEVADHGNEIARAAFLSVQIAFSRDPALEALVRRIPVYPEAERDAKLRAFFSQIIVANWFVGEAAKRGDSYLMAHAVSEFGLYAGRLILAYNRMLYPYHKWLMHEVARAPEKPPQFIEMLDALL